MTTSNIKAASRRFAGRLSLPVLALLALACLAAPPAQAERVHSRLLSETLPDGRPFKVAVNQSTHHFYVVSLGEKSSIYNFEPNGQIDPIHPKLSGPPTFEPFYVAVDNSGGAHAGYVYSSDVSSTVQQYDPSGVATSVKITESSVPANGTAQGGGLPPVVNTGSFHPQALTVDSSGSVFVIDGSAEAIDVFDPTGAFVEQLAAGIAVPATTGIAIDAAGDIFVSAGGGLGGPGTLVEGLYELDPSGDCVSAGCAPIDPEPIRGVAVDKAGGKIYTTASIAVGEGKFSEYEASTGTLLGVTHPAEFELPYGIAVDEASGEVIVADDGVSGSGTLQIYGPVEVVPDVKTLPPTEVGSGKATLNGEIGAAGIVGTTCIFQYVDEQRFEAHGFEGAPMAPCQPGGPFSGEAMNAVHAEVEGLKGGTLYHERILGSNGNGSNPGKDIPFETAGPTIGGGEVAEVSETAATLKAVVNPHGSATSYRFQYLTQAQFEASGWSGATEVPAGGQSIGEGTAPVPVSQRIEGLTPGTAYRFRTLAVSSGGESIGEEVSFAAYSPATTGLPDDRRYEQASPIDKNGANVEGGIDSVRAALQGGAITFFANTGVPGGEGSQEFPIFMARRAADGSAWSTQGLLPPGSYGNVAHVLGFSEDLQDTYDYASREGVGSLLHRSSSDGLLVQVGTLAGGNNTLAYAGSSQNGAVALLESAKGGLLSGKDLAGKQNVYAYGREANTLAVAGILNDGSVPAAGAMAGPYFWPTANPNAGGASSSLFTQDLHTISADGSRVFFTAAGTGQLYVRLNPLAPQSATSGEECTEPAKACTIRISAPEEGVADPATPAAFVGASADGSLAYFLDNGKLTADATGGAGYDLYRYDLRSGKLTDISLDTADKRGARVEGMLGIGESGEDAYFVATGALSEDASQAPVGETNLYALHGSEIEFIARLSNSESVLGEKELWKPLAEQVLGSRQSRVSRDGQTLLFRSRRPLTGYNNEGPECGAAAGTGQNLPGPCPELFLYRAGKGISCVSCNPTSQAPAGKSGLQQIPINGVSLARSYAFMTRNLSADGRRVIFDSRDRLLSADRNNVNDVYEWEAKGKGSCNEEAIAGGCLFLISSGAENAPASWFGDADEDGENVFFFTAQQLVAQDRDELVDVYDARVGGGIASQEAEPSVPCESPTACRGPVTGSPSVAEPATQSFSGPGNSKPAGRKPCKRGFVRQHGKCVRPHHHKHNKHRRGNGGGR